MPRPLSITVTRIVDVDGDFDSVAVAGQRFVDRIVHDLVDQVMQTGFAGGADVHRRPQANGFQAFQHLDTTGIVNFHRLTVISFVAICQTQYFLTSFAA